MRQLPTQRYSGLTIIMDNPSRFDLINKRLLSASAGNVVNENLQHRFSLDTCDVRLKSSLTEESLLEDTKCVLLLGARCLPLFNIDYALGECRGSLVSSSFGVPTICSYLPQDALDPIDHEGKANPSALKYNEDEEDKTNNEKSSHGKTARGSWMFWLGADLRKAARIAMEGPTKLAVDARKFRLYPSANEVIKELDQKGKELFLDIETDSAGNITCLGFAIGDGDIYVVPFILHDYQLGYDTRLFARIYKQFCIAMRDNLVVAHNGMFDLFVLAHRYRMPVGRNVYDTMLAHHRCFPEVEKSLGHCVSFWLDEPYHKNDGVFMPRNEKQQHQLWEYNAKDIATTRGIKREIDTYAMGISGLSESIAQAGSMIRPYLINTLYGIRYSLEQVDLIRARNARLMTQYLRILKLLTGKKKFNPNSNVDVPKYFYEELGYEVVKKSEKTGKAAAGAPELYDLKLKYPDNAVIDVIMAFRKLKKENGMLKFIPWKELEEQETI